MVSTANDPHGRRTVVGLIDSGGMRLYPVGRLDVDTTGLILLTNDGELANLLMHPRYEVQKTYRATVAGGPVSGRALRALRDRRRARGRADRPGGGAPARPGADRAGHR